MKSAQVRRVCFGQKNERGAAWRNVNAKMIGDRPKGRWIDLGGKRELKWS